MAQRVNSTSLRLGLNTFWISQWYSTKHYSSLFFEDLLIKFYFKNVFENRSIKKIIFIPSRYVTSSNNYENRQYSIQKDSYSVGYFSNLKKQKFSLKSKVQCRFFTTTLNLNSPFLEENQHTINKIFKTNKNIVEEMTKEHNLTIEILEITEKVIILEKQNQYYFRIKNFKTIILFLISFLVEKDCILIPKSSLFGTVDLIFFILNKKEETFTILVFFI